LSTAKINVSIIIPAKNGESTIGRALSSIFSQNTRYAYEVIIIDSGSTDNTLSIVGSYSVRLYEIKPCEFSHSLTRNYGASLSNAESYLIFLNQDAVPADEYWLDNLVKSMELEQDIKAVCATELNENRRFFNVSGVASYVFVNSHVKGVYVIEPYLLSKTSDMSKLEQRQLFPFTTVCAIFDKGHFMKHPFSGDVEWGEDLHWAVENSNQGFKSACTSLAKVFHFHNYSEQELKVIMGHTKKVYMELFGWDEMSMDQFVLMVNPNMVSSDSSRYIDELKNSLSWKVTAPLRWLHKHLMIWRSR